MNILKRTITILIALMLILGCIPTNFSQADSGKTISIESDINFKSKLPDEDDKAISSLQGIIKKFLSAIRIITALALIIIVSTTGFRYLTAQPDIKQEIKKTAFPIIMGLVIIFGATAIAGFIISAFGK